MAIGGVIMSLIYPKKVYNTLNKGFDCLSKPNIRFNLQNVSGSGFNKFYRHDLSCPGCTASMNSYFLAKFLLLPYFLLLFLLFDQIPTFTRPQFCLKNTVTQLRS